MAETNEPDDDIASRELVITRIYNVPQALMFKAWTEPKYIAQWWGPHEFTNPVCELDVRPGGSILIDMRASDGVVFPMKGTFHEVEAPERLVFTSRAFEDDAGNVGLEAHNTVTFTEYNGKTKLLLRAVVIQSALGVDYAIDGMEQGWNQSFDKLEKEIGEF